MKTIDKYILLGKCTRPHGIKGGFGLYLDNPTDSILEKGSIIRIYPMDSKSSVKPEGQNTSIEKIQFGNKVILYLKGISDRNIVEKMLPFEVYTDRENFPELKDGEYYLNDLIGMNVFNHKSKELIGKVLKFYENPAQTVLVIKTEYKNFDIPLIEQFVPLVDINNSRIEIILPQYI